MTKFTIKDIARESGVSTATVSRVINNSGYVSDKVKKQVLDMIKQMNYQPNDIARSLKQDKSRSIGMVIPDMANSYFMKIARTIQSRSFLEGYHLLFMDTEENPQKEKKALNFLLEKRIEALILAGTGSNRELIETISQSGIHIILVDRRFPNIPLDMVAEDNLYAAKAAIEFLVGKKHRKIGVIHGPESISTARERRQGSFIGLEEAGISTDSELFYDGDYTRESGILAIRYFMKLPDPPTAVFSSNNEMTFGIYLGLRELGLPLDSIEVVSFGELEFASLFQHKLSMIVQNPHKIGEIVGDLVMRRLTGLDGEMESHILLPKLSPFQTAE